MQVRATMRALATGALLAAVVPVLPAAAQEGPPEGATVVISGLNNPRGLAFSEDNTLFIAEAGVGGEGPCFGGEMGESCYGPSGAVTAVVEASEPSGLEASDDLRVLQGLPSHAAQQEDPETPFPDAGFGAAGPHDVSVADGELAVVVGLGAPPELRDQMTAAGAPGDDFAALWTAGTDGSDLTRRADLGAFEAEANPDEGAVPGAEVDTNPYAVAHDGETYLVVDAGGNDVVRVNAAGEVALTAVLPPVPATAPPFIGAPPGTVIPAQPVPTSIVVDGDGTYTVGQLTGFPFPVGAASVFDVSEEDGVSVHVSGFSAIIDVAWGPDGNLYVLEIAHAGLLAGELEGDFSGALYRVTDSGARELLLDDLFAPGGLTFGIDGMAYISNCSVCTGSGPSPSMTGHVVRFDAVGAAALVTTADDRANTREDEPVQIDVLANDVSAGGELQVSMADAAGAGATVPTDGGLLFQPAAHTSGPVSFGYQACDAEGHCATGTVHVDVVALETDRIAGSDRIETAVRTSRATFPGGAAAVLVARADEYADALTAAVLARVVAPPVGAPILLTPSGSLDERTSAEIRRLGATTAYVLGGAAAISDDVVAAIESGTGVTETVRVAGSNRFATAAAVKDKVAELTGAPVTEVYIAEGADDDPDRGFPDVLSVAALAAHQQRPILLVTTDTLPAATSDALDGVSGARIVGGRAAVSDAVAAQVAAHVDRVNRLAGATRYETSVAVADAAIAAGLSADLLWVATGANWPDAVTAGPSVAKDGGILLLVAPDDLAASPASRDFVADHRPFEDIDLLGGTSAISAAVEAGLRSVAAPGS